MLSKIKNIVLFITCLTVISCGSVLSLQDKLISEHPEWTTEQIELIRNKKISIGMTEDMVRASWGEPGISTKLTLNTLEK